jgi:hypothetical protein
VISESDARLRFPSFLKGVNLLEKVAVNQMPVRASHGHKSLPFAGDVCHLLNAEEPNERDFVHLDVEIHSARFKYPVERKTQHDCQQ